MPNTPLVSQGKTLATIKDDASQIWGERITQGIEYKKVWDRKYQTDLLEEFYYGHQAEYHNQLANDAHHLPYISNRFFVAIDVKMPSLLFQNPSFEIAARPTRSQNFQEDSAERAQLNQDTLNHFFKANVHTWGAELDLAILDSFFRFGVVEVGFTSDWIDNPDAGKPVVESDVEIDGEDDKIVKNPSRIPVEERMFLKRIPANRFIVSTLDSQRLDRCAWFAYWEYFKVSDLVSNKNYDTDEISIANARSGDNVSGSRFSEHEVLSDELNEQLKSGDLVRLWKVYDLKAKKILYLVDEQNEIIREKSFKRIPIFTLKFRERLHGFYPLPMAFNWISPQLELNETREAMRMHRRRFKRKFLAAEDAFEHEEFQKVQYGDDGVIALVKSGVSPKEALFPVPNADLGSQHLESSVAATNDFDNAAGVTADQRGEARQSGITTATQANILDKKSSIRESRDRVLVANFLCAIGKEVLLQARERLTLPFWIKLSGSKKDDFSLIEEIAEKWEEITSADLGDEAFDIDILVSSMSPVVNDEEKRKYIEFLSLLTQFPMISSSPALMRVTAEKVGFRDKEALAVLQRMAQAMQAVQLGQLEGAIQESGGGGEGGQQQGQVAQGIVAQQTPPDQEEIRNQISIQAIIQVINNFLV